MLSLATGMLRRAGLLALPPRGVVLFLMALFCCAPGLWAQGSASADGAQAVADQSLPDPFSEALGAEERLDALMERARVSQASIESLRANFIQRKESPLLLAPEESRGTFSYLAPGQARWEFLEPDATTVLLTEEEMLTWYRDLGMAERLRGDSGTERLLQIIGAAQSLDRLRRYFDLRAAFPKSALKPVRLYLSPRSARVEKRVRDLEIWLHRVHYVPVYVRYVEGGGDTTELEFQDLEVNVELPASYFELELPPEVEVREINLGGKRASNRR